MSGRGYITINSSSRGVEFYDHARGFGVTMLIRDDARRGTEPVPPRCADDQTYETCERRTLDDGTEIVVGQGARRRFVAAWGRDGDLIQTLTYVDGVEPDVTIGQLTTLATDE